MAHPGGRPPLYTDPDELQLLVDKYFETEDKPTLAGLAYYLGMSRETLNQYKNVDKFSDILRKAREKVLSIYESRLLYSTLPTGVIFALKNMGWKDRTDVTSDDEPILPTTKMIDAIKDIYGKPSV